MSKALGKLGHRVTNFLGVTGDHPPSREDSRPPPKGFGIELEQRFSDQVEQALGVEDVSVGIEAEADAEADAETDDAADAETDDVAEADEDEAEERRQGTLDVPSTSDIFSPRVVAEEEGFMLPEDQLSVDLFNRANPPLDFAYRAGPLFLSTAYDEFSRAYCTVNVGAGLANSVELVRYGRDEATSPTATATATATAGSVGVTMGTATLTEDEEPPSGILKHYCPTLTDWYSSHKSSPDDTLHLLSGSVCTDRNVLIRLVRCSTKQSPFEPVFGSLTLYAMIDEELVRLSESVHFDATPQNTRRLYGSCYIDSQGNEVEGPGSPSKVDFGGCCVNVADASGERKHLHMFNLPVPQELRGRELFLVVQTSLSTERLARDCASFDSP
ncbi:hypothetical protein B484DRAFT_176881 [Ochromonadaceae sp. CCMP2298]|nr:hypothetical protein B484DRAFT_176881 [Ochromonadaceae sp. CCMP2298]